MAFIFSHPAQYFRFNHITNITHENIVNNPLEDEKVIENTSNIVYIFILPIVCIAGIFGNILSFLVLLKMPCKCSSYTYLTVKTASDTMNCILLLVSVITHGFFYNVDGEDFDLLITLPVASIFNGVSVLATLGVTLDRCMYLWDPTSMVRPAYCSQPVARRIMALASLFAILFNLPYFFIFVVHSDGNLYATKFFKSRLYYIYNWLRLTVFGIIPCIFLIISTGILIYCIRKVAYTLRHLSVTRKKELLDPTRMSCTLITIVVLFIIGEFPSLVFSKKAAFVFLYSGDPEMITKDQELDKLRFISLILGAVNCSSNFMVFYMLHPPFGKGLKVLFSKKEKKPKEQVLVNVFFISGADDNKWKRKHLLYYDVNRMKSYPNKIQEFSTWITR